MTALSLVEAPPTERIVDATLRCLARWGLAKTTVDDVAREAGVSRATLYRLFPGGRDAVLDAVVAVEARRFFRHLDRLFSDVTSLADLLVIGITEAARVLSGHAALQFLLAHEPEAVLPHLAFQRMDSPLRSVAAAAGPYLDPWLGDAEASARGAEWIARIVFSYLVAPSAEIDVTDADSVRHLVTTYILPGLVPAPSKGEDSHG